MANKTVTVEGLKELDRALEQLPLATSRNIARKVLKKAAQPVLVEFKSRAPRLSGELIETSAISTRLSKRQKSKHRAFKDDGTIEMFIGAGPNAQSTQQEFGNENIPAQPSLTPAWENNKVRVLTIIKDELGTEIEKSAKRLRTKNLRNK